jgi:predicted HicB family RNase H-like nuclease
MRNYKHSDREKVRIDFTKAVLDAASNRASAQGQSLSRYVEGLVLDDLKEEQEDD